MTQLTPDAGDKKLRQKIFERVRDAQTGIDDDDIKLSLAKLATKELMQIILADRERYFQQRLGEVLPESLELATRPRVIGGSIMTLKEVEHTIEYIKGFNSAIDTIKRNAAKGRGEGH